MYVLQVTGGKERTVVDALQDLQIRAYVPQESRLVRKGGAWNCKLYTLFPGYTFVELEYNAANYYAIKKLPYVLHFLGADGLHPERLSYLEVEWIKTLANQGKPLEPTKATLDADGKIVLQGGILQRFRSRIVKLDKHSRRADVELTVCGEPKTVTLSFDLES